MQLAARLALFRLDKNKDRYMIRVSVGPLADLFQAGSKRLAGAPVVDILNMHDFETRLVHHAIGIELRIGRQFSRGNHSWP